MNQRITKIVFIEPKSAGIHQYTGILVPRLGLVRLASIARDQFGYSDVCVYNEDFSKIDMSQALAADVVCIHATTSAIDAAYAICGKIREQGKKEAITVLTGAHAAYLSDEALQHCDFVVRGDAEIAFFELIQALENGEEKSLPQVLQAKSCPASERAQAPDLTLIKGHQSIKTAPVFAGMSEHVSSFDSVYTSLKKHQSEGRSEVFFTDDDFTANTERVNEFLAGMIRENCVPKTWTAQMNPYGIVRDRETIALLKRTNCSVAYMPLESVNPSTLKEAGKRQSFELATAAIRLLKESRIYTHGLFVFGTDSDTSESLRETTDFVLRNDINTVQFMILTPVPGTTYFTQLKEQGRIFDFDWNHYDAGHTVFYPKNMSPYELQTETFAAMQRVYRLSRTVVQYLDRHFTAPPLRMKGHKALSNRLNDLNAYKNTLPKNTMPESQWSVLKPCATFVAKIAENSVPEPIKISESDEDSNTGVRYKNSDLAAASTAADIS